MSRCMKCGRELSPDEVGLHKKLINRGASEYMCMTCLAEFFGCSEELLKQKIAQFREMGCALFSSSGLSENTKSEVSRKNT